MPRIVSDDEMKVNAERWGTALARDIPPEIGYCLLLFRKNENGMIAQKTNVNASRLLRVLRTALERAAHKGIVLLGGAN